MEDYTKIKGRVAGPWVLAYPEDDDNDHWMRVIEGGDGSLPTRVAFIGKSPRVRVGHHQNDADDWKNWHGGSGLRSSEFGRSAKSRAWCDRELKKMGFTLKD